MQIDCLLRAIKRLNLGQNFANLIKNILTNRTNQVNTAYGPTDKYIISSGLDQGDALLPLLWRIFYNPLLQ